MKYSLLQRGNPIIFNAELAVAIGLNEAIVLQKIVDLLDRTESGKLLNHDGERWLFNTYESWQEQFFPFLSVMTVQRTFVELERKGLLVSCQPEGGISRRKYYRLGEGAACHLVSERLDEEVKLTSSGRHQNDMIDESKRCLPLTGNTTEKTTETLTGADGPVGGVGGTGKRTRERNPVIEALACVDGSQINEITAPAWSAAGKALSQIKAVSPDVTAEEVLRRAENYRAKYRTASISALALAKHWAALSAGSASSSAMIPRELLENGWTA